MNAPHELQALLCEQWCDSADIVTDEAGVCVSLPLVETDGDHVSLWLQARPGGWKVTDLGTTMMRLSYTMDTALLGEGQRAQVMNSLIATEGVSLQDGELSTLTSEGDVGGALLRMGQAVLRLGDMKLWQRTRIATTFYEDLEAELHRFAPDEMFEKNYLVPDLPDAQAYPVDFAFVDRVMKPLYLFGVATRDKARLVAITLMHLQASQATFDSLVVIQDLESLGRDDPTRLINAANDTVVGLGFNLDRKLRRHLAAA